jgi:DNA segregation ATPase FtsK/SpoIIIE-like protein
MTVPRSFDLLIIYHFLGYSTKQNCSLPHSSTETGNHHNGAWFCVHRLKQSVQNRRTGRGIFISWPPGLPDITFYECFFLWTYTKDSVYEFLVAEIKDLKDRTEAAVISIVDRLQRAGLETESCLDTVSVKNGAMLTLFNIRKKRIYVFS